MPIIIFILAILFALALICLAAFGFSVAVPNLIADPTSFWDWLLLIAAIGLAFGSGKLSFTKD